MVLVLEPALGAQALGLSKAEVDAVFDEIVDFSGIEDFIDTQVKFYSSGMYVRLAFAVAVHVARQGLAGPARRGADPRAHPPATDVEPTPAARARPGGARP